MAPSASIWEPNLPSLPSGVSRRVLSDSGSRPRTNLIALASATGTLVAALATLVSVYMIVLDEIPPVIWNVAIINTCRKANSGRFKIPKRPRGGLLRHSELGLKKFELCSPAKEYQKSD